MLLLHPMDIRQISARLPKETVKKLAVQAIEERRTQAEILTDAIEQYVERYGAKHCQACEVEGVRTRRKDNGTPKAEGVRRGR